MKLLQNSRQTLEKVHDRPTGSQYFTQILYPKPSEEGTALKIASQEGQHHSFSATNMQHMDTML